MEIDKLEFLHWMKRIIEKIDILGSQISSKTNTTTTIDGEELLDNQDVLILLKTSSRSLQRYRSSQKLPYYTISGKLYYKKSDVQQFIRDRLRLIPPSSSKPH